MVFATDSPLARIVPYSAVLSFPPRGVTVTSGYHFEYDLHLIKIPSHLDRESIYKAKPVSQNVIVELLIQRPHTQGSE